MLYYIYCIWVKTENGVLRYYGHTENMTVRKGKHVNKHKAWVKAGKPDKVSEIHATRSVYILEHEDWRMDVVDKIECETKDEARALEGKWIFENECVNMRIEGRTKQEYRETHKQEYKEYKKQYNQDHKEQIKEYKKQYYETHKQQFKEYQKQYYEDHKEKISEYQKQYQKQYHEQNRVTINEKNKEKVTCDICGLLVRKDGIPRHRRSKKCIAAKLSQQITNAIALSPNP